MKGPEANPLALFIWQGYIGAGGSKMTNKYYVALLWATIAFADFKLGAMVAGGVAVVASLAYLVDGVYTSCCPDTAAK